MRVTLLAGAVALVAGGAHAQSDHPQSNGAKSDQVRRGPAPAWAVASEPMAVPEDAGGPVFVRRQDIVMHLDARGQAQYVGYRIKILQSAALQIGNLTIAWNPEAGPPTVHAITVHRDGQPIDVLKTASFEVLRREDQLEAARLDGMLTAVLRVPDLRVGDELEVALTTLSSDPTMGGASAGALVLGPSPAPGRYRLALNWDAASKPNLRATPDLAAAMRESQNGVELRFDDPTTLTPPKDAPPRYQWQRIVQFSSFSDWATVSRHFAPLFDTAARLAPRSPVKAEADRIAAAHARPLDRAGAALKLVQQDVRYIYVGLNGGNLRPASAEETWQRRWGDCKGKTALLLALLHALGIEAEPVLANTTGMDDGFDQRLPSPQLFDHVLVRATIEGKTYWLDGTLPAVVPPGDEPFLPFRSVLPLRTAGASLEKLGWHPATRPEEVHLFELDARGGFDQPATITTTSIVRGVKGLQQQAQFSALSAAQLLTAFREQGIGDTFQAIDKVDWRYDIKAAASVLTITGTGTIRWDKDGDGARSLALAGGGFSPPERRLRAAGQNADAPFYAEPDYTCHVTTVRLPSSTQPRQWSSKPSYDQQLFGRRYHRAFEQRDGAIRMVRGSRVDQPEIDAATATRDNARIAAFDNSMGYVFYDPARTKAEVGDGATVPATYDIDWTGVDVPCLGPTKAK